jgi:hypothetical protein
MLAFLPLAAVEDWLKFVIPLVFFIIYAINHLISAAKANASQARNNQQRRKLEGAERPPRPPQQQAAEGGSGQAPGGQAPGGQAQLNAEIEQFLKRATERRGERPRREAALKTPPKAPPKPPRERVVDVEPIPRRDFGNVASSVEKHLGDRGFRDRAEHLADDIVRADQQMEQHLQKAFGHKVGTLSDAATQSVTPATDAEPVSNAEKSATSVGLAALLSNSQHLRQMVVLNEILQRPEHRW